MGFYVMCRFVLDICRRLQEKKTYLVYTAVGCLGVPALDDLVKEVNLHSCIVYVMYQWLFELKSLSDMLK